MKFFGTLKLDIDIYKNVRLVKLSKSASQSSIQIIRDAEDLLLEYRDKFSSLFKVLFDIQDEESRNLRLVEHYIQFIEVLKKDRGLKDLEELQNSLIEIQRRLKSLINTDILYDHRFDELLNNFKDILKKYTSELEDVMVENLTFISGALYFKNINGTFPTNGVVVAPGTGRDYKQYEPLIYRLVMEEYAVLVFNLPSQGSEGNWRVGLMSTYIYKCVRYLRSRRIKKVGVIGHSIGAVATVYALGGYNEQLENYTIEEVTKYIKAIKLISGEISRIGKEQLDIAKAIALLSDLYKGTEAYDTFKQQILEGVKATRFQDVSPGNIGSIDCAVLLSTPESLQDAKMLPKFCYSMSERNLQIFLNGLLMVDKLCDFVLKRRPAVDFKSQSAFKDFKQLQLAALKIKRSEFPDFLKYINDVVNPFDFMSLLDYFSKYSDFIRHYTQGLIKDVPKLFLYGKKDSINKPFIKKGTLEKAYHTMIGTSSKSISYEEIGHHMMHWDWGLRRRVYVVKSPQVLKDIINFVKSNIGSSSF